jgi:hypothetical protein
LFKKLLLESEELDFFPELLKNGILVDDEVEMFVMSYFSWFLSEFVSGKREIVDKGWIGCVWIKRVPEDESTPTFNAVFHFFKTVPAYQEVDTHSRMFVSFEQVHVFPAFDAFSFFLVVIFQ